MTDAELMKDTRVSLTNQDGEVRGRKDGECKLSQAGMAEFMGYNNRTAIAGVEGGATGLSNVARSYLRYIREVEL